MAKNCNPPIAGGIMGGGMGLFALGMLAAQAIRIVRNRAVARTLPVHDVRAHLPNVLPHDLAPSSKHSIRVEPLLFSSHPIDHDDDANSPTEATTFLSPRRGSSPLGPPLQSAPHQTVTSSNTLFAADARPTKFDPDTDRELPPDELAHTIAASLASSFPIDAVVQPTGRMTVEQRALAALDGVFESSDEDEDLGGDGTEIDVDDAMYDRDADIGLSWSTASSSVDRTRSPSRRNSSSRFQRSGSGLRAAAVSTAIEAGGARNVLVVPAPGTSNGAMPRSPTPPPVVTAAPPLVITSTADASHAPVPRDASKPPSAVVGASTPGYEPGRRVSSQFLAVPSSMSLSLPSSKSTTRSPSKASSIDEAASSEQLHRSHPIARETRRGSTSTPTSPDTRTPPTPSTQQSSSRHLLGAPAPSRTTLDGAPAAAAVDVTAVAHAIAMESLRIDQATTRQQQRQRMLARRNSSTSTRSARAVARQRLTSQRVAQSTSQLDRTGTTARPSVPLGRGEPVAWSVDACNARIGRDGRPARRGAAAVPRAEPSEGEDVRPLQAKRRESREEKLARRSQWVLELMTYESVGV
ncbi:hypothetical protein GGF32_008506 [Allomyces javanicus]|nr:hypothetical protein GGF32_008506 [Allomyces javanicus]